MSNFFKIHGENKIGYKCLTDADLGRSTKSHQTHIGLFDDVLTFLPDNAEIDDAILIYNNQCDIMLLSFDRIGRGNGEKNSPKSKMGGRDVISITSSIRNIVGLENSSLNWFLFWFGLESQQPVFFLFNNSSKTFTDITNIGVVLSNVVKGRITNFDNYFNALIVYLENIVNTAGGELIREMEIASQASQIIQLKNNKIFKPRFFDIEKANENFKKIGRKGEELINTHLGKYKQQNAIKSYSWSNERYESGLPYDFTVQENNDNIIYLDVKSTSFDFGQKIIFSGQELDFISNTDNNYRIYRVFNLNSQKPLLKVCDNSKECIGYINHEAKKFEQSLLNLNSELEALKIALNPSLNLLFGNTMQLF